MWSVCQREVPLPTIHATRLDNNNNNNNTNNNNNDNNGRNGRFYVAGYLIEERRRWPVITASPRGQCSK